MKKGTDMLVFLHMPKTGGHSFRVPIYNMYGVKRVLEINDLDAFERCLKEYQPGKWDCIIGHMPYGISAYLQEQCTYYVVLREPVDRFISDYFHIYNKPRHPAHKQLRENSISLADYARIPCPVHFVCHNAQVRRLCSYDLKLKNKDGSYWWSTRRQQVDEAMLEEAKYNLSQRIKLFGVYEWFEESFHMFCKLIGVQAASIPKKNVSPLRKTVADVDADTLDAIREANRYDIALYEFAKELWLERAEVMAPALM